MKKIHKFIIAFSIMLVLFVAALQCNAQTVVAKDPVQTEQTLTKTAVKTLYNYKQWRCISVEVGILL